MKSKKKPKNGINFNSLCSRPLALLVNDAKIVHELYTSLPNSSYIHKYISSRIY